jgi:hypothetical protein
MKLEDQVCGLEQAKKLKESGIDQSTQWYWCYPVHEKLISSKTSIIHASVTSDYLDDNEGDEFDHNIASAYSVAELGIMLPSGYDTMHTTDEGWRCYGYEGHELAEDPFATEAQARADAVIKLIENKVISSHEINLRFNT